MLDEGQVKVAVIDKLTEKYAQDRLRRRPDSPWIESQIDWAKQQLKSIKHTYRYADMDHAGKSKFIIDFFAGFKSDGVDSRHRKRMGKLEEFF